VIIGNEQNDSERDFEQKETKTRPRMNTNGHESDSKGAGTNPPCSIGVHSRSFAVVFDVAPDDAFTAQLSDIVDHLFAGNWLHAARASSARSPF
jgi:hypothetical protein